MAFTIFSVLESVDQSNLLAAQTSHWQFSSVFSKALKPSCGIIAFEPICQSVLPPKRLSFLEIRLPIICANRHIYQLENDHMYSSFSPHYHKIAPRLLTSTLVKRDWINCGSEGVYFANTDIQGNIN